MFLSGLSLGIVIWILTAVAVKITFYVDEDYVSTTFKSGDWQGIVKFYADFSVVGAKGALISFFSGVLVYIVSHYIQKIDANTVGWGWVLLILMVIWYVALALFCSMAVTDFREVPVFLLMAWLPSGLLRGLVMIVLSPWWEVDFWLLPWIVTGLFAFSCIRTCIRNTDLHPTEKDERVHAMVTMVVVAIAIAVLVSFTGCSVKSKTDVGPSSSQSESGEIDDSLPQEVVEVEASVVLSDGEKKEVDDALTIPDLTGEDLNNLIGEKYKNVPETLLRSSLTVCDKKRTEGVGFSDALTFGFSDTKDNKIFAELQEEILRNPVYGMAVAKALFDKKIGDETIGDHYCSPWMGKMIEKDKKTKLAGWCEYRDTKKKAIYVNGEYRGYAAKLCTFLERLVKYGVEVRQTSENWCLNNTLIDNERAGVKASYQYKKDSFVLAYVLKNGKAVFVMGFNFHDKRPEFFVEKKVESSVPVSETHRVEESSKPENSTPEYSKSESSGPKKTESPEPTKVESSGPTKTESSEPTKVESSTPTETSTKKDPTKAPETNTEPNDVSGPGPDTNSGKGAGESTKDQPTNSTKYPSYEKYKEDTQEVSKINQGQKTGEDNNKPTTEPEKSKSSVTVDNNGNKGTGNGGINTPTPVTSSAETVDGGKIANDKPGVAWGGPPD